MKNNTQSAYKKIQVKTTYLQLACKKNLYQNQSPPTAVHFQKLVDVNTDFYLSIYQEVGKPWGWSERLLMEKGNLEKTITDKKVEIWIMYLYSEAIGFSELDRRTNNSIELVYFGLKNTFTGKGLGQLFLNFVVGKAEEYKVDRFWLHTCEYDSKYAINTYKKAGFEVYDHQLEEAYYPIKFLEGNST